AFGETVVIDWGLAKDLTAGDEPSDERGAASAGSPELTTTGSVLGTPVYMAPEQARGEHVDQRADVYAIGTMLWQLCSLDKQPPAGLAARRRALRGAAIDPDLIAIIDKALSPDPTQRYADAGGLAADLKAFKAGARIAARSYGVLDRAVHWIRRHRAWTAALAGFVAILALGGALYVRAIAAERDRVEAANAELVLGHAELQLRSDPTAAAAELAGYRGGDRVRRDRMLAEAAERGVADVSIDLHAGAVLFAIEDPDGGVVAFTSDRQLLYTAHGVTAPITTDIARTTSFDFDAKHHLLAFQTSTGIGLLDLYTRALRGFPAGRQRFLSFDPAGNWLAGIDTRSTITVWSVADGTVLFQRQFPGARWGWFAIDSYIAAASETSIRVFDFLHPDAPAQTLPFGSSCSVSYPERVLVGDRNGSVHAFDRGFRLVAEQRMCTSGVSRVIFLGEQLDRFMYACDDGVSGMAEIDEAAHTLRVVDDFPIKRALEFASNQPGSLIAIRNESNAVHIYDPKTRLIQALDGMPTQVTLVLSSARSDERILVGDAQGHIKIWNIASRPSRAIKMPTYTRAAFLDDHTLMFTGGRKPPVLRGTDGEPSVPLVGSTAALGEARRRPDGGGLLAWGDDRTVWAWRSDGTAQRTPADHRGGIASAAYIEGGRRAVSVGDDGRALVWAVDDSAPARQLWAGPLPLIDLAIVAWNDHAVVEDRAGALIDLSPSGARREIRAGGGRDIGKGMAISADGERLAVLAADGAIVVYDVRTWQVVHRVAVGSRVLRLYLAPDHTSLLAILADRHAMLEPLTAAARAVPWRDVASDVLLGAYSPDGKAIALACADGSEWLYAPGDDRWRFMHDHAAYIRSLDFSPDGHQLVSFDDLGTAVVHDVARIFAAPVIAPAK
ncbi:MAG TPA: hypothetical protein VFP84_23085, partial [Kofleriaceae bacterium]|nr:hypothetical protein [Kofleriaceae bacterium]